MFCEVSINCLILIGPLYLSPSFFGVYPPPKSVFTSLYTVAAVITFSSNAGATSANGFIDEPVCFFIWVALFHPAPFFSPKPPATPNTFPVL